MLQTMRSARRAGRAAGPAGPAGRCDVPSAGVDVDGHGHAVRDDVEYGGPLAGLLHDRAQLVRVVAAQREADPDLLVAVADLVGEPEDAEKVDVALDGRGDLGQGDAA